MSITTNVPTMRQRHAITIILLTLVLYTAGFLGLYPLVGASVAALTMLPVTLLGWLLGWPAGSIAALVSVPLNIGLFSLVGADGGVIIRQNLAGVVVSVGIGAAAGGARHVVTYMRAQAATLTSEREALRAEIAKRQRMSEELARAKAAAEEANRAKSIFLAHMSHELRTPLTAILGYAELLQLDLQANDYTQFVGGLTTIEQAGKHLLALIEDLLDLGQIEAGKVSFAVRPCVIGPLVEAAVSTARPLMEAQGNQLQLVYPADIGTIEADPTRIQQVLLNLLSATATWTAGGRVTIAVERSPRAPHDLLTFQIHDTGQGITQEEVCQLLRTPAFSDGWLEATMFGTGLSLAISQRLCRLMGGELVAPLERHSDIRFLVHLPVRPPEAEPQAA